MKVIVGMSGGVDSSVTASLLRERGYEVEGVSLILYEARMKKTFSGCCSIESIKDAGRTAARIGVPHTALDLRDEFMTHVIEPFIDAYAGGITPNPCILCNRYIKFPSLLRYADERKAEFIATGHYAITESDRGRVFLKKGVDTRKDQSYVLYVLGQDVLHRLVLPLGEKRKDEVREIARALDLPAAKRPESQEICFIEDKNYCRFIDHLMPEGRDGGPIVHVETGETLGMHRGIHSYTVGQRKRLGISSPEPLYVVKIDTRTGTVCVGPKEAAMIKEFTVEEINWLSDPQFHLKITPPPPAPPLKIRGGRGSYEFRASVKVRSTMKDEPATLFLLDDGEVRVVYDGPQWAPAPGQSAVFYDADLVMGGGIIGKKVGR